MAALPRFARSARLDEASYFLANPRVFFHRYADTGFKTKWCGLWRDRTKYLDYFALQADGAWLGEDTCTRFAYDFATALHLHEQEGKALASQRVYVPAKAAGLVVEVRAPCPRAFSLKLAVDIRSMDRDVQPARYRVHGTRSLRVQAGKHALHVCVEGARAALQGNAFIERHAPSGEAQQAFVPPRLCFKARKARILLGCGRLLPAPAASAAGAEKVRRAGLPLARASPAALARAYQAACLATDLLALPQGHRAGLPWFARPWGRDTLWALPALAYTGRFVAAKNALLLLQQRARKGRVPNRLTTEQEDRDLYNSIDATLLYFPALAVYAGFSRDTAFLRHSHAFLKKALAFLEKRETREGWLAHDKSAPETWMDTLHRGEHACEVQALYAHALKSYQDIRALLGKKPSKTVAHRLQRLRHGFARAFCAAGPYPADRLFQGKPDPTPTCNPLVAAWLGLCSPRPLFQACRDRLLWSARGTLSRARHAPGFDPAGYHTGQAWSLATGWLGAAAFAAQDAETGWQALAMLMEDQERDALGSVGECWNPDTLALTGCGSQLWGNAWLIRLVIEGLLGLRVDAQGQLSARPCLPRAVRALAVRVRVGRRHYWARVASHGGKARAHITKARPPPSLRRASAPRKKGLKKGLGSTKT